MDVTPQVAGEYGTVTLAPAELAVGSYGTWAITYVAGKRPLIAGADIRIRPYGNPLVRPPGQTSMPREDNFVTVEGPAGVALRLACDAWLIVTVTVLVGTLAEGDALTVTYGDTRHGSPGFKLKAVSHDLRFRVSVKTSADADPVALPQRPLLRLRPDTPACFLVRAPSVIAAEEDVDLLVRAVDQFGNTVAPYEAELSPAPLQGLEMPASVTFDGQRGAYSRVACRRVSDVPLKRVRISVCDSANQPVAISNPIELNAGPEDERIYWGDLHCHSDLEQGLEPAEFLYEYARDQERLDFIAHVEHNLGVPTRWTGKHYKTWKGGMPDVPAYNADTWEYRQELARRYEAPGRFIPILGLEWSTNLYGHMNVYYPGTEGPLLYPSDMWDSDETPASLFDALQGHEAIVVPHHSSAPVGTGNPPHYWATSGYDWSFHDPRLMRLVEIYSKWGSSEHFGCQRPLLNQQEEGCVSTALARGYRLGFVGASDTHASRPGSVLYQDHTYSHSGLTAVFAPRLDRESLYQALKARRCYATTGPRIILRLWLNGHFMGEEVELEEASQTKDLFLQVAADGEIDTVEVLKNGMPFYCYNGHLAPGLGWWRDNGWEMETRVFDKAPTSGTDYYYVRVRQRDGGMAWSSPIWVSVITT